jgi:hypothetical protein
MQSKNIPGLEIMTETNEEEDLKAAPVVKKEKSESLKKPIEEKTIDKVEKPIDEKTNESIYGSNYITDDQFFDDFFADDDE